LLKEMIMKPTLLAALIVAGASVAPLSAQAASFDCAKARAADEKAICADRGLNDKDVKMSTLYEIDGHLVAMGRRGDLHDEQVQWLSARKACGAARACLNAAYDRRIVTLQSVLDEVYTHGPF
jgi:uncharacterized protein